MAGKIQNEDIKTQAELTGAGGAKSQLPNAAKVYLESFAENKTLKEALDERLLHGTPMEIHQAIPADAKLYFEPSTINTIEGKGRTVPPVKSQIPTIPASSVNFQTGATTGGTFDIALPASTVGFFRRVGFSLLSNGVIKAIFSDENAVLVNLANPGTLFVKGALPIGYLEIEATAANAFKTAGSVTNVVENKVSGNYRIFTFGSGGGGGSGSGDTTDFEQSLQRRLEDALGFEWVTPNIFSVQEEALIDGSTTAIYDIANSEYDFTGVQFLLSIQQYDATFLVEQRDSKQIELHAIWSVDDDAATYEISQDGGDTLEEITMEKIGDSLKYRGIIVLAEPVGTLQASYDVSNAGAIAELNAGNTQSYAIPLPDVAVGTKKRIQSGNVYINKVGTPVGELRVKLVPDLAGSPDLTTLLGSNSEFIDIGALTAGNNIIPVEIPAIVTAQSWWLVIEASDAYRSSFVTLTHAISVRVDTSSPSYSEGDSFRYNGAAWLAHAGNHAVFELTGFDYDLRVKITSSQNSSLLGYGVFYGEYAPQAYNTELPLEVFELDGDADETELTLTKFFPNISCKVYIVNTGQVLRYPAFAINGRKIVVAAGQFLIPGTTVTVLIDQADQGFFDSSDANATLLASNHLGSSDPSVSMAMPGRGVVVKRPDGVLREITLDNSDNIVILSVP